MDRVKEWLDGAVAGNEQLEQLRSSVESTADSALTNAKHGIAAMQALTNEQIHEAQGFAKWFREQYATYDDKLFSNLKLGIYRALENPVPSVAVLGTVVLLTARGPRRVLLRNTIGRFRSEEALLVSAEKRVKEMKQSVDLLKNESKKLEERALLADEEFHRGKSKLKATGGQLRSLEKSVYKTESRARGLMDSLRELSGGDALRLRAAVANMTSEAKQHRHAINKRIDSIARLGIPT